jgi:acyl-CoA dehydrogenase
MSSVERESPWMTDELRLFRDSVRQFIRTEFAPHQERWHAQLRPDAEAWTKAGATGLLLADVPDAYGGGGGDFAYEAVVIEELARAGIPFGSNVQSIVAHHLLAYATEEQKGAWLPRMARGELVAAIAMTEPDAGSDLLGIKTTARRRGDRYVITGSKTFVTNGWHAGLLCVAVKTDPKAVGPRGISLVVVESQGLAGYRVGRSLEKVGRHGHDTCEVFFDDVEVPATNLLGGAEGHGFFQMMEQLPYERLSVGVSAAATAEEAVAVTAQYVKDRMAFGRPLLELQNTRFKLAECHTEARVGRVFIDDCIARHLAGTLDPVTAAMAKYWLTDCACRVVDECVQLHGGYGYMAEYPIARMWVDSRAERIYAGANEVMKELIGWSL